MVTPTIVSSLAHFNVLHLTLLLAIIEKHISGACCKLDKQLAGAFEHKDFESVYNTWKESVIVYGVYYFVVKHFNHYPFWFGIRGCGNNRKCDSIYLELFWGWSHV